MPIWPPATSQPFSCLYIESVYQHQTPINSSLPTVAPWAQLHLPAQTQNLTQGSKFGLKTLFHFLISVLHQVYIWFSFTNVIKCYLGRMLTWLINMLVYELLTYSHQKWVIPFRFWDVLSLSEFIMLNAASVGQDHCGRNPPAAAGWDLSCGSDMALKAEFERAVLMATKMPDSLSNRPLTSASQSSPTEESFGPRVEIAK